jgi:hypothetical protein
MNRKGNFANSPGPVPGPKGVIKQHHAMASGYEIPTPKRRVDTFQREGGTGCAHSPGLTGHRSHYKG